MEDPTKSSEHSLMKMLLSAPVSNTFEAPMAASPPLNLGPLYVSNSPSIPSPISDMGDESQHKLTNYFQQLSGATETEVDVVQLDHCYAKPWNWRPETSFMRPCKTLFINSKTPSLNLLTLTSPIEEEESEIDVVADSADPAPIYDMDKAKRHMDECENHAKAARLSDNDDWEEALVKDSWNATQHRLFNKMLRIIQSDRLGRLVYANSWNEPVLRRAVIDKSVKRTRHLLSSVYWDTKLIQWLHTLLVDNLNGTYLTSYLDILQTLKSKIPTLVDKMMFSPNSATKMGLTSNENLFPLLRRSWDPVSQTLLQHKPKKLPGNPIILIVPSSPNFRTSQSRRLHNWVTLLNHLGMVVAVHTSLGNAGGRMTMTNCLDQMVIATRAKLQEVRNDCPNRPIILVGFNSGGAVACQVADMEAVTAVVSLGFPLQTAEGPRGEPDDMLMELQVPVLFVIGQCALTASPSEVEDLREHMRVETGLIVVGSADDYLRVSMKKRRQDGITQGMLDRCIVDEIGDFIGSILMSPYPPQIRQSPVYTHGPTGDQAIKKPKVPLKRRTSTGSETVDSEPASPQPKKTMRPVGRPPKDGKYVKPKIKLPVYQEPMQWSNQPMVDAVSPSSTVATCGTSLDLGGISPGFHQLAPTAPHSIAVRPAPKGPNMMSNNPIVRSVNKILSTADALRQSNSIDAVNEAVANILPPAASLPVYHQGKPTPPRQISTPSSLSTILQGQSTLVTSARYPMGSSAHSTPNSTSSSNTSGIRVIENITLPSTTKFVTTSGRSIDISKFALMNTVNATKLVGDKMVILGDNTRLRTTTDQPTYVTTIKGVGGISQTPITIRTTQAAGKPLLSMGMDTKTQVKYMTKPSTIIRSPLNTKPGMPTRKHIFTTRPRLKSSPIKPPSETMLPNLADLSGTNILDIPIIFADNDGALLPSENLTTGNISAPTITHPMVNQKPQMLNKVVLINKQNNPQVTKFQQQNKEKTLTLQTTCANKSNLDIPSTMYTKIVLSKRPNSDSITQNTTLMTSVTTPKTFPVDMPFERIDIEQQIKTITLAKPVQTTIVNAHSIKNKPELKSFGPQRSGTSPRILNSYQANKKPGQIIVNKNIITRRKQNMKPEPMDIDQ